MDPSRMMGHHRHMECSVAREALSARLDGEHGPVPAKSVDAHLQGCPECRLWHARAADQAQRLGQIAREAGLRRQLVAAAAEVGDESLRRAAPLPVTLWAQWSLALAGVVMLALTVIQVMTASDGRGDVSEPHLAGESVAWSIAVGAAMIFTAVWPAAAAGLSGTLISYTAVLVVYVVTDAVQGVVSPVRELGHLPVLVGAVLALLVWRGTRQPRPAPRGAGALDGDGNPALYAVGTPRRHPRGGSAA